MVRKLTPRSSLENLKREAKRWLTALRANDAEARARLERATPDGPPEPTLRDVHHALALEHGYSGWKALTAALERFDTDEDALAALLEASGRGDVALVAELLDAHPGIASARGNLEGHFGKRTALHFAVGGNHEAVVRSLLDRGAGAVALSLGSRGMVWSDRESAVPLLAACPPVTGRSTVGCGDAMLSGIAVGLERRLPTIDIIRLAVACGTANCYADTPAMIDPATVARLTPMVVVGPAPAALKEVRSNVG